VKGDEECAVTVPLNLNSPEAPGRSDSIAQSCERDTRTGTLSLQLPTRFLSDQRYE